MKPWTSGDIVSICCAILYVPLGLAVQPRYRTARGWIELLGTGLSLGTLLMVLLDPLRQVAGFGQSLLAMALDEGRATLWWSAAIAAIYLVRELFERAAPVPAKP